MAKIPLSRGRARCRPGGLDHRLRAGHPLRRAL